jgi:hypothetical protein
MKKLTLLLVTLPFAASLFAQSKIFKEVSEEISTQMSSIIQDNTLVGYVAFTRLEKANTDSFNYRLTILDENLNDISKVDFRQAALDLQTVSFEQNVLCLSYVQSTLNDVESVRTRRSYKKVQDAANSSHILLQFIQLSGKIINTWYRDVNLNMSAVPNRGVFSSSMKLVPYLKHGMQLRNIPNSGFAFFYGDEVKQSLMVFDTKGQLTREQEIPMLGERFYLRTSAANLYLLVKTDHRIPEGGYKLYVYSAKDIAAGNNFDLRDGYDNWLKVLTFENDPATGDPFIAGCIINPRRDRQFFTANDYSFTPYLGLFTLDLGNPHKEMHANCSYWSNDPIPGIGEDGMFTDKEFYVRYAGALRDYNGNTIFVGTALSGKGVIGSAKYKLSDGVFVRQESSGTLALDNNIPCDETKYFSSTGIVQEIDRKEYHKVVDPDTKTNYMIIDDELNIYIYNINTKKVARTISHKDGNIKINVYPAKEGHMMVAEYNKKEKYTRYSIEAL